MKRLLFIETFGGLGHLGINRLLINGYRDLGLTVDLVMREGYCGKLQLPQHLVQWAIPNRWFPNNPSKIRDRYCQIRILLRIKKQVDLREYDYIVFSYFDEVPLFLSGIRGNLFLICHGNVSGLNNPIKKFFLTRVAERGSLVVFHEFIRQHCEWHGISNVLVEPHGMQEPFSVDEETRTRVLQSIDERLVSNDFAHIVFVPKGSKFCDRLIERAIADPRFMLFLADRRIVLVIMGTRLHSSCANVVVHPRRLSDLEFQAVFLHSSCVILSYPKSFTFRVSAILFECFSNNKPCVLSAIESFKVFEPHFNYDPFFIDIAGLMTALETVLSLPAEVRGAPYGNLESLTPRFARLLADDTRAYVG